MESPEQLAHKPGNLGVAIDHIGVRDTLNKLDEKYRVLIELVYCSGYTQEEVAEETGVPLGTVKTRLRVAMSELRKLFGDANAAMLLAFLSKIL